MSTKVTPEKLPVSGIAAMADGQITDVVHVKDPVFARQALGDTIAFQFDGEQVTLCSPVSGILTTVFSSGEAFGITMDNGVELLIQIGVHTDEAEGKGFEHYHCRQGESIHRGDRIVTVDYGRLSETYDMTTMLIITNPQGYRFSFLSEGTVQKGQSILRKS